MWLLSEWSSTCSSTMLFFCMWSRNLNGSNTWNDLECKLFQHIKAKKRELDHTVVYSFFLIESYLDEFYPEFFNVQHVKNEVDWRVYRQHEMCNIDHSFYVNIGIAHSLCRHGIPESTYEFISIGANRETLTKDKNGNHSFENHQLL